MESRISSLQNLNVTMIVILQANLTGSFSLELDGPQLMGHNGYVGPIYGPDFYQAGWEDVL